MMEGVNSTNLDESRFTHVQAGRTQSPLLKKKSWLAENLISIVLVLVVVVLAGGLFWTYRQYTDSQKEIEEFKDPDKYTEKMEEEAQKVLDDLGKIMFLPEEKPTVATIVSVDDLKQ